MKAFPFLTFLLSGLLAADKTTSEILEKALQSGDLKTVESLLASGMSPDLRDRYGQTPLYLAMTARDSRATQLLLAWHANPNESVNSRNRVRSTPLQFAAQSGNLRDASLLLAAGANINVANAEGKTALHFAGRQLDMVRLLLEKGAEVNARDAEGASALDNAVWSGSLDTVAILLAHGARVNEPDTQTGATPINEAAFRGYATLVRYLLQFHPDATAPDKRGFGPLDNAVRMGKEDAAVALLEAQSKEPRTPEAVKKTLDSAIQKNEPRVVSALLENGADANLSGNDGSTPLEDAALRGFGAVARALLDHGAEIDHLNAGSGTTALYAAAAFGKAETVKLLLDRGANPALCGKNGKAPYSAALANGYREAAALIQLHGGGGACLPAARIGDPHR